jgi:WD40 repeat protein
MRVTALRWNQRGGLLATADEDGVIRIWDLDSGDTVGILDEHAAAVYALAWRPDGRQLASASSDGTIRIWG